MDKKIAGLVGAISAVAPMGAIAAPMAHDESLSAPQSYADLLKPIPNAIERLKADDAVLREQENAAKLEMAQYYHHHHHHHRFFRRYYHHHHHHHHHHWWRRYHHHHHHHHHHHYY